MWECETEENGGEGEWAQWKEGLERVGRAKKDIPDFRAGGDSGGRGEGADTGKGRGEEAKRGRRSVEG